MQFSLPIVPLVPPLLPEVFLSLFFHITISDFDDLKKCHTNIGKSLGYFASFCRFSVSRTSKPLFVLLLF